MRVSVAWLGEMLGSALDPGDLANRLTMAGLEVEAIEPAAPPLEGIVVGEIVACGKHPDADSLKVCQVNDGDQALQVVCGAPNARVGLKAPFATIGAKLPGGLEIRKAKIRGVESFGMLCSARELGLAEDASGLMELPDDASAGTSLYEALSLDDTVLEVALTPNRGDCMSMLGIAREVSALTGQRPAELQVSEVAAAPAEPFPVELVEGAGCARFASRVIRGVEPDARSPLWMQERLRRAGFRPINAVVDITNYVMLELGQPMHAYDLREIDEAIVVRKARAGERLMLLDGREVTLDESVLVIADRRKAIGLAGIMGGEHSGIDSDTRDVLLEVAFFLPDAIAGRGRRYGLVTDASQRFERGVNPVLQEQALERATQLICEIAGGTPGPAGMTECPDDVPASPVIDFRPERARRVIGATISDTEMAAIVEGLGMNVSTDGSTWKVRPPPWRFDLSIEEDVIEEVARVYGFDRVPEAMQAVHQSILPVTEARISADRAADILVQRGYHEAVTYSFVDPSLQSLLHPHESALRLANPISADLASMRVSLWPGLIKALTDNQRRQQARVRLFEVGRKFLAGESTLAEVEVIAGIAGGGVAPAQWGLRSAETDFYDVKGDLESLLKATGQDADFRFETAGHAALHPGQSARILRNGQAVGWIGRLHPVLEKKLGLTYSAVLFELETASTLAAAIPQYAPISRFPAVRRDLAAVVDDSISVQALLGVVRDSAGPLLTDSLVFDIYRGEGIASGRKSVAIGLNLQDISRTLTDEEIDAVVAQVVADLKQKCDATIRDK